MTCTEIAMESRIPPSSVHHVITEVMGKRKVNAWWVLRMSDEQTMQKEITTQLLACYQKDKKFLKHNVALMRQRSTTLNQN